MALGHLHLGIGIRHNRDMRILGAKWPERRQRGSAIVYREETRSSQSMRLRIDSQNVLGVLLLESLGLDRRYVTAVATLAEMGQVISATCPRPGI